MNSEAGCATGDTAEWSPASSLVLTVIGSAAAWSTDPARPSSCYLVESGDDAVALDLGQGSFAALARIRRPESLVAVLISHLHPDHHVDLVALRHYLTFARGGSLPHRVELHTPPGLRGRYDAFLAEPGFLGRLHGTDIEPGVFDVGPFAVEAAHVTHIADAFALRVRRGASAPDGPALVYSGDCGDWTDLVPLIRPGDTLLSEAFWSSGEPEAPALHLTARDAAMAASTGRASRLVLTHLGEDGEPAAAKRIAESVFDGEVLLAEPGLRLTIE
jgi:ribonuclease BN (tRNA processing enzyme)